MNGTLDISKDNGICRITFSHPQGNSLPGSLLRELADAISGAGADDDVKVIILQSGGDKVFCAGASFDELLAVDSPASGKEFFSGFARVINAMRKAPKFVIARVQGKAVGGGVGLICASDYAIAVKSASVRLSELAVGIGPFVVGPAVERKIGSAAFSSLAINATGWRDAEWASGKGMYAELHDDIPGLDHAVDALCVRLAASNPEAMRELKKIFREGTEHWDQLLDERAGMSGRLVLSDFTSNAIRKFREAKK